MKLLFLLLLLSASTALADEAQRLSDTYAVHGTYDQRIHSPSPQAGMLDLWQSDRTREALPPPHLPSPEPQRTGAPESWKR